MWLQSLPIVIFPWNPEWIIETQSESSKSRLNHPSPEWIIQTHSESSNPERIIQIQSESSKSRVSLAVFALGRPFALCEWFQRKAFLIATRRRLDQYSRTMSWQATADEGRRIKWSGRFFCSNLGLKRPQAIIEIPELFADVTNSQKRHKFRLVNRMQPNTEVRYRCHPIGGSFHLNFFLAYLAQIFNRWWSDAV